MTPAQKQEILNLRTLKLTPKQIAGKLGIKVLEVNATIHNQAEQRRIIFYESVLSDFCF